MSRQKYFGTDGIRGQVGKHPITPDFVLKLGWAVGKVFAREGVGQVLIGKDTRISGYMLESSLEAGLASAGVASAFTGPMPTPAIAYLTQTFRADAGIVISASHNPFYDNGIKFFSMEGKKLPDAIELAIEAELKKPLDCVPSDKLGRASRITDAAGRYIEFCKSSFDHDLSLAGLKIVVDCANGATYHIAPNVLRELGATVVKMGCEPNGMNINENCGATSITGLRKQVIEEKADVGFALDGDGDRIIMVDHLGNIIDGDKIIYVIAKEAKQRAKLKGGIVGTLMSNMGLEIAFKQLGIPFERAKVGDRHVLDMLTKKGWQLGAENSGHVLLLNKTSTGDGIIAGLQVLSAMVRNKMTLNSLCSGMTLYPQVLINVRFYDQINPLQHESVKKMQKKMKEELGGKGRILLRKSGTEPLIRIMVEGENEQTVRQFAQKIANFIKNSE